MQQRYWQPNTLIALLRLNWSTCLSFSTLFLKPVIFITHKSYVAKDAGQILQQATKKHRESWVILLFCCRVATKLFFSFIAGSANMKISRTDGRRWWTSTRRIIVVELIFSARHNEIFAAGELCKILWTTCGFFSRKKVDEISSTLAALLELNFANWCLFWTHFLTPTWASKPSRRYFSVASNNGDFFPAGLN